LNPTGYGRAKDALHTFMSNTPDNQGIYVLRPQRHAIDIHCMGGAPRSRGAVKTIGANAIAAGGGMPALGGIIHKIR